MGWAYQIDPETRDRILDPVTGQLVKVGTYYDQAAGKWVTNGSSLQPDLIHAVGTPLGSFPGDLAAGSEVQKIMEAGSSDGVEVLLEQAITESLQVLVDDGRLTLTGVTVVVDGNRAIAEILATELTEPFTLTLGTF